MENKDTVSYLVGFSMGSNLHGIPYRFNVESFLDGVKAALEGRPSGYASQETQEILSRWQQDLKKKEQEKLQTQQWAQIQSRQKKNRRQANQKLFETIEDNIDDVSNTLPPPRKTQEYYIKPAVDVNTNNNTSGIKLMTPVMYKPAAEQQQTQTKQLPSYNWNLKNINEQE